MTFRSKNAGLPGGIYVLKPPAPMGPVTPPCIQFGGYGQYTQKFHDEMSTFENTYGYKTWWVGGGFWSPLWQAVFNHFDGQLPSVLQSIDFTPEGSGITMAGLELIASGIFREDGAVATIGLCPDMMIYLVNWENELKQVSANLVGLAQRTPVDIASRIAGVHDYIAQTYNAVYAAITQATQTSKLAGVPTENDLVEGNASLSPVYTVMLSGVLTSYAQLMMYAKQAEQDAVDSAAAGRPIGIVADTAPIATRKESKAWMWLVGGGLVLGALGIGGYLVYRDYKPGRSSAKPEVRTSRVPYAPVRGYGDLPKASKKYYYYPGSMDISDPRVLKGRPIKRGARVVVTRYKVDPQNRIVWIMDEHGNEQSVWKKALHKKK